MTDVMTTTATMEPQEAMAAPSMEESIQRSPKHVPTDSMVTVPLSETDGRTPEEEESARESMVRPNIIVEERRASSRTNSTEIREAFGRCDSQTSAEAPAPTSPTISVRDTDAPVSPKTEEARGRRTSNGSGKSEEVDWAELEKKEEQEPEGEEEVGLRRLVMEYCLLTHAGHGIAPRTSRAGKRGHSLKLQIQHESLPCTKPVPPALVQPTEAPRGG